MFYVKETINDAVEVKVEIDCDNVYCRCPRCCREVQVDLGEFFCDEDFDIYTTSLFCEDCSRKVRCDK